MEAAFDVEVRVKDLPEFEQLASALRRAEAEREEARRDAEAVRAAAGHLTEETQQMTHLRASVAGQQKRAEQAEAELDAATTQLAKKFKRLEELERRCTQAESERNELRATVTRLNRRAQTAEAGVRDNVEASKAAGKSMGRTLANAAADMYRRRAEKAEAERDAQHAEVLRLTGERDAAREKLAEWQDVGAGFCWFAVCIATNQQAIDRFCQVIGRERLEKIEELESTRDLLTEENARLQKEYQHLADQYAVLLQHSTNQARQIATLELLLRGGK